MKKFKLGAAALLMGAAFPSAAFGQMAVIDSSNLARAIETARNTLTLIDQMNDQIAEQQKLYAASNRLTDVSAIAQELSSDWLERGVPTDIRDVIALASTNLDDLGSIGRRAQELLAARGYSRPSGTLDNVGPLAAARDQAIAENGLAMADRTAKGISELKRRLRSAETEKETADLQARATLEVAQLLNQANQRAALQDAQSAALKLRNLEAAARNGQAEENAMRARSFMPSLRTQ